MEELKNQFPVFSFRFSVVYPVGAIKQIASPRVPGTGNPECH